MNRLLLIAVVVTGIFTSATAQDIPGKKDSITSAVLNQKRYLRVILPEKYKPGSADKYDVLYVLDDWNIKLADDIHRFIQGEGYIPATIIVGIINIDRDKDLTPTHVADNKTSGGAPQFLAFLKTELIPYIDKNYPTNGDNAIFGHSFGGLFVTWALLHDPLLFKSYIAADPSFWWDKNYMDTVAIHRLPKIAGTTRTLYMSGREGEAYRGMGIVSMDSIFKIYAPKDLTWTSIPYPDETHGSVRLKSMYDGLKFVYAGFTNQIEFHPMNGTLLKDKPVKIWVMGDKNLTRYTTDGSQPTFFSNRFADTGTYIKGPAKLTVTTFTNRARYNKTLTGDFKIGETLPAKAKAGKYTPGGLGYSYYEGQFDKLPDFSALKPLKKGVFGNGFSLDSLPRKENFALLMEGEIEIKQDGYYVFGLDSDDGSKLYIGGQLIVDYDGLHGPGKPRSYVLPLEKGFYQVRLEYFQKDGGRSLNFVYLPPDKKTLDGDLDVPKSVLYHK